MYIEFNKLQEEGVPFRGLIYSETENTFGFIDVTSSTDKIHFHYVCLNNSHSQFHTMI